VGWSLSEASAALFIVLVDLLLVSQRCRDIALRAVRRTGLSTRRLAHRPPTCEVPVGRPIEVIASEARRLGQRYRFTRQGVSFAKSEAVRRAYDGVLAEGCDALGVAHLLSVIRPGEELDAERVRVERILHMWGLQVDDAA
jgi:hypothetical protein